jgi:hypothetical protein
MNWRLSELLDERCAASCETGSGLMWQLFYRAGWNIYHRVEMHLALKSAGDHG